MLLPRFAYHRPTGLAEALEMLGGFGAAAKVVAGGTDLFVNMKHGKLAPAELIGLERLEELKAGVTSNGRVTIGALTRAADLAANSGGGLPAALAAGGGALGSPQVRNRATVGGNLVSARPAADICVPLLALGASAVLAGPGGQRGVPLTGFFTGPGQTVIAADEILTGVTLKRAAAGSGSGYQKLGLRKALEISLVNVAACLELDADGKTIRAASVSLGAVAPTPILAPGAAAVLVGAKAGDKVFAEAAKATAADARPIDDHRGTAAYRRDMVEVLTRRALADALLDANQGRRS